MAGLIAGAFVLSYDDLRKLALRGGARPHFAPLYPAMVDGLVVMTILSLLLARRTKERTSQTRVGPVRRGAGSHWWSRLLRWSLLVLLVAGAGAIAVQRSIKGYQRLPHAWVSAGVAAGPWIILLIAAWLWLTMVTQARALRMAHEVDCAIIPGLDEAEPAEPDPADLEPTRPPALTGPEPTRPALTAPAPTAPYPMGPGPMQPARAEPEPANEPPAEAAEQEQPAWARRPPPRPDVKLVGRQVPLGDTDPDGIPTIPQEPEDTEEPEDTDDDLYVDDRAEDPDGGDGGAIIFEHRSDIPPSSTFRSSPVPPGKEDPGENLLATGPNGEG